MTIKLTLEADIRNAQEVDRTLAEFEKRLNSVGQAGESLSEYVNKGLGAIGDSFEKLTKSGASGSVANLSRDMEGLG